MRKYINLCLSLLICFSLFSVSRAETSGSLPLLKIAPDARSVALGATGAAVQHGAMSAFHNPALMAFAEQSQASFGYSDWLLDISMQTAALLFNYDRFTTGLSINTYSVPDIERRVLPSDDPIETFSAHDFTGGGSFAYKISDDFAIGLTGRWIHQEIYIEEANGYAFDAGAAYRLFKFNTTFGAAVRNLGKMDALEDEESPLPADAVAGFSSLIYQKGDFGLNGMADAQFIFDDDIRAHAGLEGFWRENLFLRLGYQTGSELRTYSGGVGIAWNRFGFDYAFQPMAEDFEASHRFGFKIKF